MSQPEIESVLESLFGIVLAGDVHRSQSRAARLRAGTRKPVRALNLPKSSSLWVKYLPFIIAESVLLLFEISFPLSIQRFVEPAFIDSTYRACIDELLGVSISTRTVRSVRQFIFPTRPGKLSVAGLSGDGRRRNDTFKTTRLSPLMQRVSKIDSLHLTSNAAYTFQSLSSRDGDLNSVIVSARFHARNLSSPSSSHTKRVLQSLNVPRLDIPSVLPMTKALAHANTARLQRD